MKLRGDIIALPGTGHADFLLKGRIDLLLLEEDSAPPEVGAADFPGRDCWIIDFKTGSSGPLTARKIEEGAGLQAILYALAIRAGGAASTAVSVLNPGSKLKAQVRVEDSPGLEPLFRSLDKFHREGVFGMRPGSENYGYAPEYPLATRAIPSEILKAKWVLTHGVAADEAEGGE
jgi:hypothetical protein